MFLKRDEKSAKKTFFTKGQTQTEDSGKNVWTMNRTFMKEIEKKWKYPLNIHEVDETICCET